MTLILEIAPDLEKQIRQAASKAGISPDTYVLESVTERLSQTRHRQSKVQRLSAVEARLLEKINQSLSQIQWQRYQELIAKRQAETLTTEEQRELISLSDQVEEANVKRIEYLAELADLQQTTVPTLMKKLGLTHQHTTIFPAAPPEFLAEIAAFEQMKPELLKTHRGRVVAIHAGKVVAVGDDVLSVHSEATEKLGFTHCYVEWVLDETPRVVRMPSIWKVK